MCRICKKIGHFAKLCKSELPAKASYNTQQRSQINWTSTQQQQQRYNQLATKPTQQKKNVIEQETENNQEESEETIDPEATCYIREMMQDWQNVNFIEPNNFTKEQVTEINKKNRREFRKKKKRNSTKYFG